MAAGSYWTKALALNTLFATRHNHSIELVRPPAGSTKDALWCKVPALLSAIQRAGTRACHWVAFLDSDAYFNEHSRSIGELLAAHGADGTTHLVVSREEALPSVNFTTPFVLNSGVVFVRASERGAALLREWQSLRASCTGKRFHRQPEQKCLELLLIGAPPRVSTDGHGRHTAARATPAATADTSGVALAPMVLFNSPWGRYVRHIWGGPGAELRPTAYDDALRMHGVRTQAQFELLVARARRTERTGCGS